MKDKAIRFRNLMSTGTLERRDEGEADGDYTERRELLGGVMGWGWERRCVAGKGGVSG